MPSEELTDAQIEKIAERAADIVFERIHLEIGRNVLRSLGYLFGAVAVAASVWLAGKGFLK